LVLRVVFHRLLSLATPLGRKLRPKLLTKASPLVRVKPRDLRAAGVERVPRTVGVEAGRPKLEDGRVLEVDNVIWCNGFGTAFSSWIDLPILNERSEPRHEVGMVPGLPGLYFVGLHFLSAMSSGMIHGVGRDAERIAQVAIARARAGSSSRVGLIQELPDGA
jgi:putative flavoprotein involved in K+ transport